MQWTRNLRRVASVAFVLTIVLARGAWAEDTAPPWPELRARWARVMEQLPAPGMAVAAVLPDGTMYLDALGTCDAAAKKDVSVDSPFYIASSTKSFTAMAVCMLIDEGKVDLDAPVREYLPRFCLRDPEVAAKMTVRDLLAHRQGINSGIIATGEAYTGEMTDARYYRLLALVKPSGKFQYSNLNFTLLGRVIESVTGLSWQEFIKTRILQPAGMHHSYCLASKLYADPLAADPLVDNMGEFVDAPVRKTDRTMHAAGGMGTSARDLAQWLKLNLNGGRAKEVQLISERLVREMHTLQADMQEPQTGQSGFDRHGYGLGWFLGEYRRHRLVHHFGGYTGARAHISFLPDEGIGVAVLVNTSGPGSALADIVAADIYDKLLGLPPTDHLDAVLERAARYRARAGAAAKPEGGPPRYPEGLTQLPSAYAGRYLDEDYGIAQIEVAGDSIVVHLGDYTPTLRSTGPDRFESVFIPGSRLQGVFQLNADGEVEAILLTSLLEKRRFVRQTHSEQSVPDRTAPD